jgi:N-acetylglucosaminyl-diphospho-decaprenol L-rhamnosyltransferase
MVDAMGLSVTVSIVSHGQGKMIESRLKDLSHCPLVDRVVLTYNIPEEKISYPKSLEQSIKCIHNRQPLGFGANHNQAFRLCETELFAVLNPDIRLNSDPFLPLVKALDKGVTGVIAPAVFSPCGRLEDSARRFPTFLHLLRKLMRADDDQIVRKDRATEDVDWVAGMFLLFPTPEYRDCGGFDENFYLYYEDVDICARLWKSGRRVILCPSVAVIHLAQRASHRNLRYMAWHFLSMLRFFIKHMWRLPR